MLRTYGALPSKSKFALLTNDAAALAHDAWLKPRRKKSGLEQPAAATMMEKRARVACVGGRAVIKTVQMRLVNIGNGTGVFDSRAMSLAWGVRLPAGKIPARA